MSFRTDLILVDIQMPVIDGYEATRRIKVDPNLKRPRGFWVVPETAVSRCSNQA